MSSAISSADVLRSNILQTILTGFVVIASIIKVFHSAFEYLQSVQFKKCFSQTGLDLFHHQYSKMFDCYVI